jgi:hypothetical protein
MLLALGMVLIVLPSYGGIGDQSMPHESTKVSTISKSPDLEATYSNKKVNANPTKVRAQTLSIYTVKNTKKVYKKKVYYKVYKKVYFKKVYRYRYYYHGKYHYRYKVVYRYRYKIVYVARTVKAISVKSKTTTSSNKPSQGTSQITAGSVSADGRCSCSLHTDYKIHHCTWLNYCPYCKRYGTLAYTTKGCSEGMFYCKHCDADFCIVHGKEHINKNARYLTKTGKTSSTTPSSATLTN